MEAERNVSEENEVKGFFLHLTLFRSFVRPQHIAARIISIIITILVILLTSYAIAAVCTHYLEYPTKQNSHHAMNNRMEYPKITICSKMRIKQTTLDKVNISQDLYTYMSSIFDGYQLDYSKLAQNNFDVEKVKSEYAKLLTGETTTTYKLFTDNSFLCSDFLKSCSAQGQKFSCCRLYTPFLGSTGMCFEIDLAVTLENDKPIRQTVPGKAGRLSIQLNHQTSLYPKDTLSANQEIGAEIWLTRGKIPEKSFSITPGQKLSVALTTSKTHRLAAPYGNCQEDSSDNDWSYSKTACIKDCMKSQMEKQCKCHLVGTLAPSKDDGKKACEPAAAYNCAQKLLQGINQTSISELYPEDYLQDCDCKEECSPIKYMTEISQGLLTHANNQAASDESLLELYHQDLSMEVITESPNYTMSEMVSEVGLIIVLWTGLSLLALLQTLLHLVYVVCRKLCCK